MPELHNGATPTSTDQDFEFSELKCTTTMVDKKVNSTTGAEFYLNKSYTYGDILIAGFLLLFAIFGVVKFFLNTIIPKAIDFKRH